MSSERVELVKLDYSDELAPFYNQVAKSSGLDWNFERLALVAEVLKRKRGIPAKYSRDLMLILDNALAFLANRDLDSEIPNLFTTDTDLGAKFLYESINSSFNLEKLLLSREELDLPQTLAGIWSTQLHFAFTELPHSLLRRRSGIYMLPHTPSNALFEVVRLESKFLQKRLVAESRP